MGIKVEFLMLLVLGSILGSALSANILYLATVASPSHHIWNKNLALGLVAKGHNITMLSHDSEKKLPKNFHIITMDGIYDQLEAAFSIEDMVMTPEPWFPILTISEFYDYAALITDFDMNHPNFDKLLNYPKDFKFDLIIVDSTISLSIYPFIDRFNKPPVVAVTPFLLPGYLTSSMNGHTFYSYTPHYMTKLTATMNFCERVQNFAYYIVEKFFRCHKLKPAEEKRAIEKFGAENVRPFAEYEQEIALLLANTDPIMDFPTPLPPNIIPVGGLHARPGKKLPEDLQKIMDEAKHGVILFSLGTNMKSKFLPEAWRKNILEGFAKLDQIVIWKFEDDIDNLPKNVITRKWLPQNDMMAHPNIKLFITHGGALSTQEAMYHGLPVVGVPCFADQMMNIEKMTQKELTVKVGLHELGDADKLYNAVKEVLSNPKYKEKMLRISAIMKDNPMTALDRAVYWVEHTLKFGYVKEYRLPTQNMNILQIYNLDILFAALAICLVLFKATLFYCKCKRKTNVKENKKEKKVKKN